VKHTEHCYKQESEIIHFFPIFLPTSGRRTPEAIQAILVGTTFKCMNARAPEGVARQAKKNTQGEP